MLFRVISQETVKRAQSNKNIKNKNKKAYSAITDFLRHIKFKVIYFDT